MAGAGFIFWGLFLVFGLIVVAYIAWMVRVERNAPEAGPTQEADPAGKPADPANLSRPRSRPRPRPEE